MVPSYLWFTFYFQSRSQRHLPVSVVNSSRQAEAVAASASRKHLRREASRPPDHVKGKTPLYHVLLIHFSTIHCDSSNYDVLVLSLLTFDLKNVSLAIPRFWSNSRQISFGNCKMVKKVFWMYKKIFCSQNGTEYCSMFNFCGVSFFKCVDKINNYKSTACQ